MSSNIALVFVAAVIAFASLPRSPRATAIATTSTSPLNTAFRRMTFRVRKASTAEHLAGHCQVDKVLTILRVGPNC